MSAALEITEVEAVYKTRTDRATRKPRVYFWAEGEPVLQNLIFRRARPSKLYRALLPEALAQLLADKSLRDVEALVMAKATWSQRAGCSCGCSPGFVLDAVDVGYDVHVTVKPVDGAAPEVAQVEPDLIAGAKVLKAEWAKPALGDVIGVYETS
jgi:hypothetical protein